MKTIIIKTNKEIGRFLNNSYIDGVPIREVNEDELKSLQLSDYEILIPRANPVMKVKNL